MRRYLDIDVLVAARQRVSWIFDNFTRICVSFSGGKDSTCMLHLVMEEARRRDRVVGVLFVDWEAQYKMTIDHVADCFREYASNMDPWWTCVPLRTTNAVSQIEPEWICWDPKRESIWVRPMPDGVKRESDFPFYRYPMTFEEFVPAFGRFYAGKEKTAHLIGIRCAESLGRWYAVAAGEKETIDGHRWMNHVDEFSWNVYPIYDWKTEDDWTYLGREKKSYNKLYDRMHQAGLSIHQMRVCEPYGYEQRRGLWLFNVIEPETWAKIVVRVSGANAGALYSGKRGSVLGNGRVEKPEGLSWRQFARLLLDTMPPSTALHYENKIAVWARFYKDRKGVEIVEELPTDWSKEGPSWRRVCKVLLRNDYWCRGIGFVPTKTTAYKNYLDIMARRRAAWGDSVRV